MLPDFIDGFATGAGLPNTTQDDRNEAKEQWAGWSRQLSDKQLEAVEAEGYRGGLREGRIYADTHTEN